MGERAVNGLSESFEKINDGTKLGLAEVDDTRTRKIKMRSFDLNINESSKIKPLFKTKSLSSHFVVNLNELNEQASFPRSNEETELFSIYESSSPSETVSDHPMRLITSRSDAVDEGESDSWRWKIEMEPAFGISLKFEDVKYSVRLKGINNSAVEKCILKGVSGSVCPGEVLALMGPSGGGKTTLLNLLSGRVKSNGGIITYNDGLYTKSLKRRIGFVLQDDTVFPHLTVKETLTYSALLRLPNTLSKQQKKERAMDVLSQLGLERCQNTMVGGNFVRGVSGGERKRVCIGNEVLLNPSLLFLDEPTSGLDSTTALHIIQMLKDIAQAGKTVVTTIHQPSSRLFSKFDKLILLSNGSSLYFGKTSEAMVYFSSIGCLPLIAMNPAEFLVDLACGNMKEKSVPSELEDRGITSPGDVHEYLLRAYESRASKKEKMKVNKFMIFDQKFEKHSMCDAEECGASWSDQFCILFRRGLKERRHEYLCSVRVVQVISTAVIAGLIWWRSDASSATMAQDQAGLLFFISVYWAFFPVFTAIYTFPLEREMLAKERSVDMYKLSAYLIARNTSDLPLDLTLPVVFLIIIYFMVGLKPTFSAFSLTLLSIFLSIIAAQGVGLTIGAAIMDVKKATALASVTVMTSMLAGGFFINKVPPFVSWIRNISLNYHTYKLLLKIQYSCNGNQSGSETCNLALLKARGLDHSGTEVGAMLVMIIGYRLLTYILLRRMKLRTRA